MDVTSTTNSANQIAKAHSSIKLQPEVLLQEHNVSNDTDTVTLSNEAIAAANGEIETPTPKPEHGGGGVYVPPVKE